MKIGIITGIILFIFIFNNSLWSQTVLLHEDVSKLDFKMPKSGPNYKNFHQIYLNFGFFIPLNNEKQIETVFEETTMFTVGWRYKKKLTNWFAIGGALAYTNPIFRIKQSSTKQIPNNIPHDKEKIKINNINPEVYIRFNFGKRGNVIGKFIDLAAYGAYAFLIKHQTIDNTIAANPPYFSGSHKVNYTDLDYVNRINYGFRARIGINRWVISGSYRLSNLINDNYKSQMGDYFFPRLTVGFEMGLHK